MPAELISDIQVWRAANQVDPGDLRPTGPPQLGQAHPSLATATRQATRRHRHPDRLASTTRHRSPQRHHGPIPTGTRGKAKQPHPGRTLLVLELAGAVIVAGAIILPFQPTFAAILAIGVVPLIAYQYWRDVRMLHMPRLAAIWRPNGPALD